LFQEILSRGYYSGLKLLKSILTTVFSTQKIVKISSALQKKKKGGRVVRCRATQDKGTGDVGRYTGLGEEWKNLLLYVSDDSSCGTGIQHMDFHRGRNILTTKTGLKPCQTKGMYL
ncbi:hypothetical protein ACJX0J_035662, partial [Zea mays]